MIDLHTHILPGLDDGPTDMQGSIDLARELAAQGTTVVAATPHVRDDYPTTPESIAAALALVRKALRDEGVELEVVAGAEIAFDRLHRLEPDVLYSLALAGANHVLVELPFYGWPLDVEDQVHRLSASGLTVVLAHPERNSAIQDSPDRLACLVESGALVQVTAGSLLGRFGPRAARSANSLIARGLAHMVASDTHRAGNSRGLLAPSVASLRDTALANWLTVDVPTAVVAGAPCPPRPPAGPSTRFLFGRTLTGLRRHRSDHQNGY